MTLKIHLNTKSLEALVTLKRLFRSLVDNTDVLLEIPFVAKNFEAVGTCTAGFISRMTLTTDSETRRE